MKNFMPISQMIERNGKTVRENNLEISHQIELGGLVEVQTGDELKELNGLRLRVISLDRDCDGTPLYTIGIDPNNYITGMPEHWLTKTPNSK